MNFVTSADIVHAHFALPFVPVIVPPSVKNDSCCDGASEANVGELAPECTPDPSGVAFEPLRVVEKG